MTSGVKQTVGNIRNGYPLDPYEIRYNPAQDRVFAIGVMERERLPRVIEMLSGFVKIDPSTPGDEGAVEYQEKFYRAVLGDFQAKEALVEGSVLIARGYERRSAPTMAEVRELLERQGADIVRETYQAGVPLEYIATCPPEEKGRSR